MTESTTYYHGEKLRREKKIALVTVFFIYYEYIRDYRLILLSVYG